MVRDGATLLALGLQLRALSPAIGEKLIDQHLQLFFGRAVVERAVVFTSAVSVFDRHHAAVTHHFHSLGTALQPVFHVRPQRVWCPA